jgi:hypothetical protein
VKNSLKFLKFIESIPMNQRVYQRWVIFIW